MLETKVGIMGFGKMPADCAQILLNNHTSVDFVLETEQSRFSALAALCARKGILYKRTNRSEAAAFLDDLRDRTVVLSINNNFIFPGHVVTRENLRIVNFHNALLPSYRGHGQSIPQWIVYHGETHHGVTWHLVNGRLDAGPILCNETFSVSEDDTALSIMMRSIRLGITLFERHWKRFLNFEVGGIPQTDCGRSIYKGPSRDRLHRKSDIPNDGYLDRAWDFDQCLRFLRSMDYSRLSLIPPPRISLEDEVYSIKNYKVEGKPADSEGDHTDEKQGKAERTYRLEYDRGVVTLYLQNP